MAPQSVTSGLEDTKDKCNCHHNDVLLRQYLVTIGSLVALHHVTPKRSQELLKPSGVVPKIQKAIERRKEKHRAVRVLFSKFFHNSFI